MEYPKVNIDSIRGSLTFGEMDQIEAMAGMSLIALEQKAQGRLIRGMIIIGLQRMGHVVAWDDLEEANPEDFISYGEAPSVDEDPTHADS